MTSLASVPPALFTYSAGRSSNFTYFWGPTDLSAYLRSQRSLHWFASYDDTTLIRRLYAGSQVCLLPIQYSLQVKRVANELAIAPHYLSLPALCKHNLLAQLQYQKIS